MTLPVAVCVCSNASLQFLLVSTPLSGLSSAVRMPELFVIGRLLTGVGIGMGTTAHGVLLAEISPAKYRGIIGSFGGFSTNIGYICASAVGLPFVLGDEGKWAGVYYLEALPSLVLLVCVVCFFHDSPVFLVRQNREQAALSSLKAYTSGADIDAELMRLRSELKMEFRMDNFRDIWAHDASRRALILSTILNMSVAFSGITAVAFFGTFLLQSIGFSENQASLANCLSSLAGTAGALLATWGIDKVGRRLVVIGSLLSLALINTLMMMLVVAFNYTQNVSIGFGFLTLFVLFLFTFSGGIGPTAWFLGAELAPTTARARVQSISVSAQTLCCFVSPIVYYPLQSAVGPLAFLVFIVPLLLAAVFFYRRLPETKGRTLEQIATQSERAILG